MSSAQEGNFINEVVKGTSVPHSNFNLDKPRGLTPRFGVNTPFYVLEVVPDDGPIKIRPVCDTRSYTLKAPMFGKIKKHVSFYQVPLQSILPFNWDKIVKNPSRGTDVSGSSQAPGVVPCLDGVNTVVGSFLTHISTRLVDDYNYLKDNYSNSSPIATYIKAVYQFIVRWEMFFSSGCLLSYLGVHYHDSVRFVNADNQDSNTVYYSFDRLCEVLLTSIANYRVKVVDDDGSSSIPFGSGVSHVRKILEFMRTHHGPYVFSVDGYSGSQPNFFDISDIYFESRVSDYSEPLNYGRCCAYQIVNSHYFTNDKVDYIYTADLYRQYIYSLLYSIGYQNYQFDFNGVKTSYDYLSAKYFSQVLQDSEGESFDSEFFWNSLFPYFNAIFGFNLSLRYMDYFVGSRPRNLAIGDTSVSVNNNTVQVVDVTKNIVKQRFLNAVARVGQSIEDYSKQIFHKSTSYDWHNPKYLFSFDVDIFNSEIENTADAQMSNPNSVTSVLRGSFGNYEFTVDIDRHSFLIGIEYFDFERFYFTTQERNTMAIDRFDMFIPELQYVGDQELRRSELLAGCEKELPFAYQLRDMQFKQSFPDCCGGFVGFLPGWLMTYNPFEMSSRDYREIQISPDFIRSKPTELDDFYLSLTNVSLGGYFHFIELWDIKVSANRPMAYSPEIL